MFTPAALIGHRVESNLNVLNNLSLSIKRRNGRNTQVKLSSIRQHETFFVDSKGYVWSCFFDDNKIKATRNITIGEGNTQRCAIFNIVKDTEEAVSPDILSDTDQVVCSNDIFTSVMGVTCKVLDYEYGPSMETFVHAYLPKIKRHHKFTMAADGTVV